MNSDTRVQPLKTDDDLLKSCPKCRSKRLFLTSDRFGFFQECPICGFEKNLSNSQKEKLKKNL